MELLAPAGGFEQLKAAIDFGADAVYLAADKYGMRARAANFAMEEIPQAVELAHSHDVKVHVASNVMMMQSDIPQLPDFFQAMEAFGVDALIIGDIGAFQLAKKYAPNCDLHVSTQASVSNSEAAKAWYGLGAKRVVCAREMTLEDISKMRDELPDDLELEAFVHGAQCMAVSGRCLISAYLTGRSGNLGACTQPCRWNYTLEEEKRPGIHFPVEEDSAGTYIMNAKDLNMLGHLAELKEAGIDSVKIEGRNKKAFYVATVVGAYRRVLDGERGSGAAEELYSVSHRPYSEGFYFGNPEQAVDYDGYEQETIHVADVVSCKPSEDGFDVELRCRNRFVEGDVLEALIPRTPTRQITVRELCWVSDPDQPDASFFRPCEVANRSCNIYKISSDVVVPEGSFLRSRIFRRSARSNGPHMQAE